MESVGSTAAMILATELLLLAFVAAAGAIGAHGAINGTLVGAALRGVTGDEAMVRPRYRHRLGPEPRVRGVQSTGFLHPLDYFEQIAH